MRRAAETEPAVGEGPVRLRLTSEGLAWFAVATILGGIGWLRSLNLVLILAYTMVVLLVLNGLLARRHVRRATVTRPPLPPVYAGEDVRDTLTVRNTGSRAAMVEITDQGTRWHLGRLPGGTHVECEVRRTYPRRGRFRPDPIVVWSGFPLDLLRAERAIDPGTEVVVLPAPGEADPAGLRRWLVREAGNGGWSRKVLRRVTTDQADVRGVRPYRPGDSLRAVHWRSSARRRELMVREYDSAPDPELVLVVEPFLPDRATPADREALEAALSLAVTVVRAWCRSAETRVTVVVAGAESVISSGAAREEFARDGVVALADVTGGPTPPRIEPLMLGRSAGHGARVVVSSRPNSPLAAALAHGVGKPFLALAPSQPISWYQPPRR